MTNQKSIFISGGAAGIGREVALRFHNAGWTVGAYDSRYVLQTRPAGNDPVVDDPAMGQYTPGFVGAMNHYLAAELGVRTSARYVPIAWTDVGAVTDIPLRFQTIGERFLGRSLGTVNKVDW